jgi:hypothetical protein
MSEETTRINGEKVRKILVEYLVREKVCARVLPRLLTLDQKHLRAARSVASTEMIDDDTVTCRGNDCKTWFRLGTRI